MNNAMKKRPIYRIKLRNTVTIGEKSARNEIAERRAKLPQNWITRTKYVGNSRFEISSKPIATHIDEVYARVLAKAYE